MSNRIDALKEIIADVAELESTEGITLESHLQHDLNISSLQALEILLVVEERLGVSISEEALYQFQTFGDVVKWIDSA